jgi:hypothetical protein
MDQVRKVMGGLLRGGFGTDLWGRARFLILAMMASVMVAPASRRRFARCHFGAGAIEQLYEWDV